jgi:hypothetical protein
MVFRVGRPKPNFFRTVLEQIALKWREKSAAKRSKTIGYEKYLNRNVTEPV